MPSPYNVAVFSDTRYLDHRGPASHPEAPARLAAVEEALAARESDLVRRPVREACDDELLAVHPRAHLRTLREAAQRAPTRLDADTFASSASETVARLAAGAAVDAALCVARGEARSAFAAVRPPGHHAEADRAMGFCLLNNVAVAARALIKNGAERLLIFDWDVHHGNGTQHLFESERDIVYVSTHQYPFYPGTGAVGEIGVGRGEGATINVPLPEGSGDDEYRGAVERVVVPVAETLRPDMILVSCGLDAHRDDPLGGMAVSGAGYRAMAATLRELANTLCGGRLIYVLEGGYSAQGLCEGTAAVLDAELQRDAAPFPTSPPAPRGSRSPESPLWRVLDALRQAHGSRYPGLGGAS